MGLRIEIRARVNPTEEAEKVKRAILNIFPDARFILEGGEMEAEAESIENFAKLLKEQRIRDSARNVLLGNLYGDEVHFELNKQAAYVGRVSFSVGEVALGSIHVVIRGENLREVIERIAPDTRNL